MKASKYIYRRNFFEKILYRFFMKIEGAELPPPSNIGKNVRFPHGLKGIVIHPNTIIGDNVTIFHQVTCGRGDMHKIDKRVTSSPFEGIVIEDGVVLCVGAKVICNRGKLFVRKNTIIGANAVLTKTTGEDEIWVGVPANLLRKRF